VNRGTAEVGGRVYRWIERATRWRFRWTSVPHGDQAVAVARSTYFEVGGLMLLAKNTQTHKILSQSFENHEVRKTYRALSAVYDDPEKDLNKSQIWQSKLVRGKKRSFEAAHGKEAITKATALEKRCYLPSQMCLVWKLEPVTGRAHQLRYEMSKRNHPIIGDSLYGSELNFKTNAIALEAIRLELLNSDTLAKLKLESGIFEIKPELTHVH
jgi:tRNA pseudouridine32 synthase/23S rRNA pseudouridine746 synthase